MTNDYGGIINELVAGSWRHPPTGQKVAINIRSIVIKETEDGKTAIRDFFESAFGPA